MGARMHMMIMHVCGSSAEALSFVTKMHLQKVVLILCTAYGLCSSAGNTSFPFGDVRNCPATSTHPPNIPLFEMEVLPGAGFDNLRNLDMGLVHDLNYSLCRVSKDGRYLLPDSMFVVPLQESKVDVYATYFDHWDNYTDMTSTSINAGIGLFSVVNGKFSAGYSSMKTHQVNDKSKTTRVEIRHKLYNVKIQPGAPLHPVFKSRLFDIAAHLQNNNTELANYDSELLVRDYGTHYLTSMDAGALLSQTDFVKSSYVSNQLKDTTKITASASANFFGKVSLSSSFSHQTSQEDISNFLTNRTHSEVVTIGGPPFTPNLTLSVWEAGVPDSLVAIDRSGDPLHYVINVNTLPDLPELTVQHLSDVVRNAINRYYRVNTRHGCTSLGAENFNFQANVDDRTCDPPNTNFTFGGVYQNCIVDPNLNTENLCTSGPQPALQLNPLTGALSCPEKYTPIRLHSGVVSHVVQKPVCNNVCHHCGLFGWKRCCQCQSVLAPFLSRAKYDAYWCVALPGVDLPQESGFLFGGYYTTTSSNPITGSMTCPRFFYPIHMGEDIKVCVSNDYELGYANAVSFAGFESCLAGNPLADTNRADNNNPSRWPHACPHGYAQHLVTVDEGCEINFCVLAGAFKSDRLLPVKLPPFRRRPNYKANVTDTLVVFGLYGQIWMKSSAGVWEKMESGSVSGQALLDTLVGGGGGNGQPSNSQDESLSNGVVALLSILVTVLLGAMIAITVFLGRAVYKRRQKSQAIRNDYLHINEPDNRTPESTAEDA